MHAAGAQRANWSDLCISGSRLRAEKGHEFYTTWGCIYLHRRAVCMRARAHHTAVCVIMRPLSEKFHVHYYQKVLCVPERTRNFSSAIATWKYYFTLLLKVLAACAPGKTLLSLCNQSFSSLIWFLNYVVQWSYRLCVILTKREKLTTYNNIKRNNKTKIRAKITKIVHKKLHQKQHFQSILNNISIFF